MEVMYTLGCPPLLRFITNRLWIQDPVVDQPGFHGRNNSSTWYSWWNHSWLSASNGLNRGLVQRIFFITIIQCRISSIANSAETNAVYNNIYGCRWKGRCGTSFWSFRQHLMSLRGKGRWKTLATSQNWVQMLVRVQMVTTTSNFTPEHDISQKFCS